ncbi:MAG: Arm DNA-binding domain-containing protein, partial [Acidimicrobiales bacterium]
MASDSRHGSFCQSIPNPLSLLGRTLPLLAGHIRKRGNSWELIAYAGRDPLTGRKHYVTRSFKGTKREAEQAVARLVTEVDD